MNPLVTAARSYKGTRFRHRGRNKKGIDCAGLIWAAYRDCGVELTDYRLYGEEPEDDGLVTHIIAALGEPVFTAPVREQTLQVGDVLVLRYEVEPHHVALVTPYLYAGALAIIHADGHNKKVIEHRLSPDMVKRITHVFRRPV